MKKIVTSGFSLVEILIAAALLGAISVGVMQLTKNMQKGQKTVELKGHKSDVMTTLKLYLSNKNTCEETLQGLVAGPTNTDVTTVTKIIRGGATPAPVVDLSTNLGAEYGEGAAKIKIDAITLEKYNEDRAPTPALPGEGTATLKFVFKKNSLNADGTYGASTFEDKIVLNIFVDEDHKVVSCMDSGGASQAACDMFGGTIELDAAGEIICRKLNLVQPDNDYNLTMSNQATASQVLLRPDQLSFSDPTNETALHIRSWGTALDIETVGGPLVLNNKTPTQHIWKKDVADADTDGDVDELVMTNVSNNGKVQIGGFDPADTNTLMIDGPTLAKGDINSTGNISAAGTVSAGGVVLTSDQIFKKNISTIEDATDLISKIRGVTFDWEKNSKPDAGFIAQEIQQIFPHLVVTRPDGSLAMNYNGVIPYLVEAIKDNQKTISRLEKRIEALEKMNSK